MEKKEKASIAGPRRRSFDRAVLSQLYVMAWGFEENDCWIARLPASAPLHGLGTGRGERVDPRITSRGVYFWRMGF